MKPQRTLTVAAVLATVVSASAPVAEAGLVTAIFDLTSTGTVYSETGGNYPPTFTADTGITVRAFAAYDGANNSIKNNIHTALNGAGVIGDPWIEVTDRQRLAFENWSVNGRLVGFTLQEDNVRNSFGSSAQLLGGASGTTVIGTWDMTDGQTLVVDLSGFTGLDQTNLFSFRTTVDVNSSFAVKELRWEYFDDGHNPSPVPEPSTLAMGGMSVVLIGLAAYRRRRRGQG